MCIHYMYIYIQIYYICIYVKLYIHIYLKMRTYVYIHVYVHLYMYIYIYMYICIYIFMHTCVQYCTSAGSASEGKDVLGCECERECSHVKKHFSSCTLPPPLLLPLTNISTTIPKEPCLLSKPPIFSSITRDMSRKVAFFVWKRVPQSSLICGVLTLQIKP